MRIVCYKPTDDDFYPNYWKDTVEVLLMDLHGGGYRVAVWGADDTGYDFDFENLIDAQNMYYELILQEKLNVTYLKEKGFTHF